MAIYRVGKCYFSVTFIVTITYIFFFDCGYLFFSKISNRLTRKTIYYRTVGFYLAKNRGLRWDELNIWWNLARQDSLRSCYFSAVPNPRYRSGKKIIGNEKKAKICLAITIYQGETREEKNRIRDFKALHLIRWVIKISRRISI